MKCITKSLISFFALLLFLAPVSFNISTPDTVQKIEQTGSITLQADMNIAHAQIISSGDCSAANITSWDSCISDGIFYVYEIVIFHLTNAALVIVGLMFDIILHFSLDSNFYRGGLMESGWSIMRDFTNIVFIFALLTIAFKLVVSQDDGKTKSSLIKTLLIALTVNFSLFFSYLIIDASNLLAYTFYNRIEASGQYQTNAGDGTGSALQEQVRLLTDDQPSVSLAIASKINPQAIIQTGGIGSNDLLLKFIVVTSAGILNLLLIYVFGSLLLLFLGRSLGLLVSGILAPLAFASLTIPSAVNLPYIGFNVWLKQLVSLAFMAPIFLFLMYLIITFLGDEGVLRGLAGGPSGGVLGDIMSIYIFFMIIGGFILLAKKITEKMAGELGGMVSKGVAGVTSGLVAGAAIVATGGAAAAGGLSKGIGAGIGKFSEPGTRGAKIAGGFNRVGNAGLSFKADVSKIPGFKSMTNASGINGLGDKIAKATGVSGRDAVDNTRYAATAMVADTKDFVSGRSGKEREDALEKKRSERRDISGKGEDGVYEWNRKLQKEKEKEANQANIDEAKSNIKLNSNVPEAIRKEENTSATAVLENPEDVKKETKAIEGLETSIKDFTAQYNAAKGNGNPKADQIKDDLNYEKIRLDARKRGVNISKSDIEGHVTISHGGDPEKALKAETNKSKNKDNFGAGTAYAGITGAKVLADKETRKGRHDHAKNRRNKEERKTIRKQADELRGSGTDPKKVKQADELLKKMETLLTDSTKERKSEDEKVK
jgi:hypothetical protein